MTGLTADLGVRCVAEGVETDADWDAVVELGCDVVQGWLVARPMPVPAATRWLLEHAGVVPPIEARDTTRTVGAARGGR